MSPQSVADDLLATVARQVGSWSPERRERHGFSLLVGDPDQLRRNRRAHARTVLAGEALVGELGRDHPVILMKGLEVAQVYETPIHRPFRDLDLLTSDPRPLWDSCVSRGFRPNPRRRVDIDHHHLPALSSPKGPIGVELHHRPNVPAWVKLPTQLLIDTAEPSRTGISGVGRPRDDLHALLLALHGWKGGFTRLRDLFDALLLAAVADVPVEETAAELGLSRLWVWTARIADAELLGRPTTRSRAVSRALLPRGTTLAGRKRARVLAPYLVANPVRVTRGHLAERRLGREARRSQTPGD